METDTPESQYLGTEITGPKLVYDQESWYLGTKITDHKLVYDQESRYLGTEMTGYLQNMTSNFSA